MKYNVNYIIQHQLLAAFILQNWDTLPLALSKETKQSLSLSDFRQYSIEKIEPLINFDCDVQSDVRLRCIIMRTATVCETLFKLRGLR